MFLSLSAFSPIQQHERLSPPTTRVPSRLLSQEGAVVVVVVVILGRLVVVVLCQEESVETR